MKNMNNGVVRLLSNMRRNIKGIQECEKVRKWGQLSFQRCQLNERKF